jgi:hypothetical protein
MRKLVKAEDYRSDKSYSFPDEDNLSQSQRNSPEYFLSCCNSIVSKYVNNTCAVPYDSVIHGRRSISELRAYRQGLNSPNKYKGFLAPIQKEVNKGLGIDQAKGHKTTINISWDILQILPQKMDVVMGYMQKINYDVQTSAIDYQALIGKKTMVAMAKIFADDRMSLMQNQANSAAGQQVISPKDPSEMPGGMKFGSPKDVDVAASVGVFFLEQEAAIQTLLTKSKEESISDNINDLIKDDLITIATAGKRIYTNENTQIVAEDYIDMDCAILPHSKYLDYRDITWASEIRTITIGQLRKELKIEEEELIKIARMYAPNDEGGGRNKNFYFDIQRQRNNLDFGMNMMDQIQVDVADCRWIGLKNVNYTSVRNKNNGNIVINKVKDEYKINSKDEKDGKELYNYKNQTVYKAKMVLGTSYVFGYGEDNDIGFIKSSTGKMTPVFPYKFVRTGNMSLVERCIGFVDDANLANYKLRVARMKMPAPPNLFIDKSMLEGVKIDGVSYTPQKLMRLLQDEGFLIGDSKNQWGQNNQSGKPVNPIGTDIINQLAAWVTDREQSMAMIDKVTGINDMFSAQTPQRTTAVGVANNLIAGTQNSLTPIVKAFSYIFEMGERVKVKKWQIVASNMNEEERKKLSINRALQTVKIGSDLNDYDFDIQIHAAITDQEKSELLQDIKDMRNLRRQVGSGGLNESDFMLLSSMVKTGKIIQAQIAMSQIIEAREKSDQQKQQQLVEQNQQSQSLSNQQAMQGEQQSQQQQGDIDLRNKMAELKEKYRLESLLKHQEAIDERRSKALENIWGSHHKKTA